MCLFCFQLKKERDDMYKPKILIDVNLEQSQQKERELERERERESERQRAKDREKERKERFQTINFIFLSFVCFCCAWVCLLDSKKFNGLEL